MDFFNDLYDFRGFVNGVEASLAFEELTPSIRAAQKKIISTIGVERWNAIKELEADNECSVAIKTAIANCAMEKYLVFWSTTRNTAEQKLYKYQYNELKDTYITEFWASMDLVIDYLDTHDLGGWKTSPEYVQRQELIVKSAKEFNYFFQIDESSYFFSKIMFLLRKVSDDSLKSRVGEITEETPEVLLKKIKRALCYEVMAQAVMLFDITELPKSLRNDITHEFVKQGSMVQVREKLNASLMLDVNKYYSEIESEIKIAAGNTEVILNRNKESNSFYATM